MPQQVLKTRIRLSKSPRSVRWCGDEGGQEPVGDSDLRDRQQSAESSAADTPGDETRLAATLTPVLDTLQSIQEQLVELEKRRHASLGEFQVAAVELALIATSQILQRTIDRNEFPIERLVGQAIERLEADRGLVIRLHPDDLRQLQAVLATSSKSQQTVSESTTLMPDWEGARFEPDATLERGSCWADGGDFGLLSTLERRIEDLRQCFMEGLDDAQVERRAIATEDQSMRRFPDRRETA